jgi:D-alanyl-D-alanine carboxypeptidase
VSARPGHSEHQSGLCIDVNSTDFSFGSTAEAAWLEEHCAEYGFIIRFPEGKEDITGYEYEPWHIRYVGVETAQEITAQGLCLEEYLNVTSDYANSPDNERFLQNYSEYDY